MKYRVCVVTGTRAEYGLLRPLLFRLRDDGAIDLRLAVTGAHLSQVFGNTQSEILSDGFTVYDTVPIPTESDSKSGMASATGAAITAFAAYLSKHRPHLLVVLGDRFEAFAAVTAAYIEGIPVAHISGGDVTEGAVDDALRHCITKMSSLHFPGCDDSARRIIQMGEQPASVFSVGDTGVENCLHTHFWSLEQLSRDLEMPLSEKAYGVVTFHPVTLEDNTAVQQVRQLILALDQFPDMLFIITTANADAGGRAINSVWQEQQLRHSNWVVVPSLGVVRYLSAVKYAKMVIGNSSSGVVEAPVLGVPTVNIGDRQKGRMMAESILCCPPSHTDITDAMKTALTPAFQKKARHAVSPFGDGTASERMLQIMKQYLAAGGGTTKKQFYDIAFEV